MLNQLSLLILRSSGKCALVGRIEAKLCFQYTLWIIFGLKSFWHNLVDYNKLHDGLGGRDTYGILGQKISSHMLSYETMSSLEPGA